MPANGSINNIQHLPDRGSTTNRVHLEVMLDTEVMYTKTTKTARGWKKTPTGTQRLLVRVFDLPGYSSEILIFPAGENWKALTDLPMISLTGTRDVSDTLSKLGVNLSYKPSLGDAVQEPVGELRGVQRFL